MLASLVKGCRKLIWNIAANFANCNMEKKRQRVVLYTHSRKITALNVPAITENGCVTTDLAF
jgi:hypothetical protein